MVPPGEYFETKGKMAVMPGFLDLFVYRFLNENVSGGGKIKIINSFDI